MHLILEFISQWGAKRSGVICIAALKHIFDFSREIGEEQKEQFDRLEFLLVKLEDKFHELEFRLSISSRAIGVTA